MRNDNPPVVKGLVWFTDGSRMKGTGAVVYGQSLGRRLIISLGKYATVLQAEIYAILVCAYEIQLHGRPEKYVSICSDSQMALKALQSPEHLHWYNSAKRCCMISPPSILWGCIGSLDMLGYKEMKLLTSSQEMVLFRSLVELSRPCGTLDGASEDR